MTIILTDLKGNQIHHFEKDEPVEPIIEWEGKRYQCFSNSKTHLAYKEIVFTELEDL